MKLLMLIVVLLCHLFAKETLYLNMPSPYPSKKTETSFGKELIRLINQSHKEIYFAIYGLRAQDEILQALIDAKKRGVHIKGVVDSDTHGKNYYEDTHRLYELFDIKSDHKSSIMHNKFFVFDQKTVWTGSSNISDTDTGGYNANNVVVIEDKKVAKIYQQEFEQMFNKNHFNSKKEATLYTHIKTSDSIITLSFSPKSSTYENCIEPLIRGAKKYIYIPIFYLTHKRLSEELIDAHKRGVEIKVILDASAAKNKYSTHHILRDVGIEVKVENFGGKMHAKSMIIDDRFIISGSMNFTKAGESKNDENTVIIENTSLTKQYKEHFIELWRHIPRRYLKIDPNPEGFESGNSCFDEIDNNFDKAIDDKDQHCQKNNSF
ncbi:MAG: phospholipase D-like domain-containing protein [Sulfurospirillaceae bacterium]|nr:phospholipase D-like domain-containing protein [Sulfurospirillaceae bacterium]MDD2827448.1 phospholipase D-like domain-containing protein [Sulfurospirillaceae bacterium]